MLPPPNNSMAMPVPRRLLLLALLAALPMACAVNANGAELDDLEAVKRMPLLSSNDVALPASAIIDQASRDTLSKDTPGRIVFYQESIDSFGIPPALPSVSLLDWRGQRRWKISDMSLPAGSVIEFQPLSFWELYKWYAVAAAGGLIAALLIASLLIKHLPRRQAEEQYWKLNEVIANVPGIVWETRAGHDRTARHLIFMSDYVKKMLGYSADEWLSDSGFAQSIVDETDREEFARQRDTILASRQASVFQFRWRAKDGRILWAESHMTPILDEVGEAIGLRGVTIDITERKQAEAALRESEERFRNMADSAPMLIWMSDHNKECIYFNKRWLDFTGRHLEQELGFGWTDGIHPHDRDRCGMTYNSAFERREPFQMEYRLRRADGEFRWVYDSGTPRMATNGKFLGYIGSCIDMTEHRAAEQALMDLSGKLIRAREDECARIARELHDDLNQRLALISLELDQLSQNPPSSTDTLREMVQAIMAQACELSTEIHRMSRDLHPSKLVHLGLVTALNSLCAELSQVYGLKIEFVHTDVPASLPQDLSLCLYRIVQESLNNVVKHSGAQEAQVALQGSEQEIRLRISDSGSGFDLESMRCENGIGLLGMRERLRLIGGTIAIDSRISQGTRIDARVPLWRMEVKAELPSSNGKGKAA